MDDIYYFVLLPHDISLGDHFKAALYVPESFVSSFSKKGDGL
jgi:hypothetical protein